AHQAIDLFARFGPGKLDADDAALEQLGDVGAGALRHLGDDRQPLHAAGEDEVGQIGLVEEAVFVLDVDEIAAAVAGDLDQPRRRDVLHRQADEDAVLLERGFEAFHEGSLLRLRYVRHRSVSRTEDTGLYRNMNVMYDVIMHRTQISLEDWQYQALKSL